MKIVYLITASSEGKGGHYYSLRETAKIFNKHEDVMILSIGVNKSPVLESFNDRYIHISYRNIFHTTFEALKTIRALNPDIIHAFDINSFHYARLASLMYKIPTIITLCGGKNPKYFPFHYNAIMYSLENVNFLKSKKKFKNTKFSLIPNRVSLIQQDYGAIIKIKNNISIEHKIFLRIARFSELHKDSILQSMRLVKLLSDQGFKVHLLVIGYIYDKEVYNELLSYKPINVTFLTDDEFTVNASRLINVADYVIGSGRSFMEAALLGKIMLAPTANTSIPIIVNNDNIKKLFKLNFSNRYYDDRSENDIIKEVINTFNIENNQLLIEFAEEHFSSTKIYEKHLPIYQKARVAKRSPLDIAYQMAIIIKPKQKLRRLINRLNVSKSLTTKH